MAPTAVARETVFALRREIARIEGRQAQSLTCRFESDDAAAGEMLVRRDGRALPGFYSTGVEEFDRALGGGLPRAALLEVQGRETREAGAVAAFVFALVSLASGKAAPRPVLWAGTADLFREAGFPYLHGLWKDFGLPPPLLAFAQADKLVDVLWIVEEAASLAALSAVVFEVRGNPAWLDLAATRRLQQRARTAGRPVFLLRQAAFPEPTAAPVRLLVAPAASGLRATLAGPLARSIGPPAFEAAISKSPTAIPAQFTLEWNADERSFHARRAPPARLPADSGALLSLSRG